MAVKKKDIGGWFFALAVLLLVVLAVLLLVVVEQRSMLQEMDEPVETAVGGPMDGETKKITVVFPPPQVMEGKRILPVSFGEEVIIIIDLEEGVIILHRGEEKAVRICLDDAPEATVTVTSTVNLLPPLSEMEDDEKN